MRRTTRFLRFAGDRSGWLVASVMALVAAGCSSTPTSPVSQQVADDDSSTMPKAVRAMAELPEDVPSEAMEALSQEFDEDRSFALLWRQQRYERGYIVKTVDSDHGGMFASVDAHRRSAMRYTLTAYAENHFWNDQIGADVAALVRRGELPAAPFIERIGLIGHYDWSADGENAAWRAWWVEVKTGLFEAHVRHARDLTPSDMDSALARARTRVEEGAIAPYVDELALATRSQGDAAGYAPGDAPSMSSGSAEFAGMDGGDDASASDRPGGTATITVPGRGATRNDAVEMALTAAVREAGGAYIQSRYETRGARLVEQDVRMVSEGVVVEHEVVRQERGDDGQVQVFVEAQVSLDDAAALFRAPDGGEIPTWESSEPQWERLDAYQAQLRAYADWLRDFTRDERLLEHGYTFEVVDVRPKNIGARQVDGEVAVWVAPNPVFWAQYEQALRMGESLARPEQAKLVGLAGRTRMDLRLGCALPAACWRIGMPDPIAVPWSADEHRANQLRAVIHFGLNDAATEHPFPQDRSLALWQRFVKVPGRSSSFNTAYERAAPEMWIRYAHRGADGMEPVPPHIRALNAKRGDAWRKVVDFVDWADQLIPADVPGAADNAYTVLDAWSGTALKPAEMVVDGGVILTFDVTASSVEELRSIQDEGVQVDLVRSAPGPTLEDLRD